MQAKTLNRLDKLCFLSDHNALKLATCDEPPEHLQQIIQKRVATIRDGWSPRERADRLVGDGGKVQWRVPCYTADTSTKDADGSDNWSDKNTKIYTRVISQVTPTRADKIKNGRGRK